MTNLPKVLFFGPTPPPITGQSVAFEKAYNGYLGEKVLISQYTSSTARTIKFFLNIRLIFIISIKVLTFDGSVVYFTASRNRLSSIRDLILIQLANFRKLKIVNHLHGADFKELVNYSRGIYRSLLINSYSKVNSSIVLLDVMNKQFDDFTDTMEIKVLQNFYDPILEENIDFSNYTNDIKIVYFSNLMYSKGITFLLDAFDKLSRRFDNISLHIAGGILSDEYHSANYIQEILDLRMKTNDKIHYHGLLRGDEKKVFLFNTDIFVLPSFYKSEAFPISIIEAMRAGAVIITTNHNYLPYVISSKNGSLIDIQSSAGIKKSIEKYLIDIGYMRKIQKYNYNYAKKHYSLAKHINQLNQIIAST